MSLVSLEILPRGDEGWGVGPLPFGKHITLLLGPNGAGKTPVVKALEYCLGHPVELPPLIIERCSTVVLRLQQEDVLYTVARNFEPGVSVTVTTGSAQPLEIKDEKTFSAWILAALGISARDLTGNSNEVIPPYMSIFGPLFIVDQDAGWLTSYVPFHTHRFVKDQREEVLRWALDIPARNRAIDKREVNRAKVDLGSIQERIAIKRSSVEALRAELGDDSSIEAAKRLGDRKAVVAAELRELHQSNRIVPEEESRIEAKIRSAIEARTAASFQLLNSRRRKDRLSDVQAEVFVEIAALEENEVAADAFRHFCGNAACQFFRKPEESYGRQVLYLKDQLKDFESTSGEIEEELGRLERQLADSESSVELAMHERKTMVSQPPVENIIDRVSAATHELSEIETRLNRISRFASEREALDDLIKLEIRAAEEFADMRPSRSARKDNTRLMDARDRLSRSFKEWLLTLRTPNVSSDVVFDEELRLIIDGERFSEKSSHSGSTRTRLVLALHAAIVETSIAMNGVHPRVLILDAPRQHELSATDLRSFLDRFYSMSRQQNPPIQLVFSATDAAVIPEGKIDAIWQPAFAFAENLRFLGAHA